MISLGLVAGLLTGLLSSCGKEETAPATDSSSSNSYSSNYSSSYSSDNSYSSSNNSNFNSGTASGNPVTLEVVTSYGYSDGNRINYENTYIGFEIKTGHKISDNSSDVDEDWKAEVMNNFQIGQEPDVLFFFTGVDANSLVEEGKVVSIEEIRTIYPDYATNMQEERLPVSPYDGLAYAVPVNGYWEGLYVNKVVLEACGIPIPGADYSWDQFKADCEVIKNAGYAPIAAALNHIPHYWFEFTLLNNGSSSNHGYLPIDTTTDAVGQKWIAALNDMKELYDLGYFPAETLTLDDTATVKMLTDNEAAFLIDGNWKIGHFIDHDVADNFTVTYVPAKGERIATDAIGGFSMGYYITRKAWDDPDTRQAAVDFITTMTTDATVNKFASTSTTALREPSEPLEGLNMLQQSAVSMQNGFTNVVGAAQDNLSTDVRTALFAGVKEVMEGQITAAQLLQRTLGIP